MQMPVVLDTLRIRQAKNSAIRRRLASGGIARIDKLSKPTTRALPGRPVPATGTSLRYAATSPLETFCWIGTALLGTR